MESYYSCPEEVTFETQIPGLSYIGIFLFALRTSWEKKANINSQEETIWELIAQLSFLSGGTIHHLTMILKGPKFKTTPQQWRPFGACHPAIINECFKCSPFVVSIGSKQKPVLSCLCCMAACRLCAGFVAKLGKGRGFNLYLSLSFFFLRAESFHSSKQKMGYI